MTRCSFWKSHSPCYLGNGADFHTAGVRGSPESVCVICTRRRRHSRQGDLTEIWEAHSPLVSLQSPHHKTLWWYMLDCPPPHLKKYTSPLSDRSSYSLWTRVNRCKRIDVVTGGLKLMTCGLLGPSPASEHDKTFRFFPLANIFRINHKLSVKLYQSLAD